MNRKIKRLLLFIMVITIIFIGMIHAFPVDAQFSNLTFMPIMSPFHYGGIWNPYFTLSNPVFNLFGFNPFGMGYPFFLLTNPWNGILSNPFFSPVTAPLSLLESFGDSPSLTFFQMPQGGLTIDPLMPNILSLMAPSPVAPLPMRVSAQAGTWVGTWQSTSIAFIILFNSGIMNMTLVENPTLNTLDGTAILVGSRFADTLFDMRGVLTDPTNFILEGIVANGTALVLNCILTSPTTMTGSYTSSFGFGGQVVDTGVFSLTLV